MSIKRKKHKLKKREEKKKAIRIKTHRDVPFFYKNNEEVRIISIEKKQVVPGTMGDLSSHIKKEKAYSNLDLLIRTILSDVYSTAKRIIGIDPDLNRETGGLLLLSYIVQSIQGHGEELHGAFNNSKKTFMDKFRVIKNYPQLEEEILKKFFGIEVNNYIKEEEEEGEEIVRIKGPYLSLEYIVRKIEEAAHIKNLAKSLVFLRQALMDATTLWIHNLLEGKKDIRFTYDKSILKLKDPKERARLYKEYYGIDIEDTDTLKIDEDLYCYMIERINGKPLLGIDLFRKINKLIDKKGLTERERKLLLEGIIIGGSMDVYKPYRKRAEKAY
ncbi:hypothetical protein J7K74_00670 [Candidatus Woesearchaeota archaeon]|nr:hypothetical protein [Candidatus Woesearchaeota archaeon]